MEPASGIALTRIRAGSRGGESSTWRETLEPVKNRPHPRRIALYLQYMFPPALMVPAFVLYFATLYFGFQALDGRAPLVVTWRAVLGAASWTLFSLRMRIYDELKDLRTDVRLGRAGDPRYADRPIVTGEVRPRDVKWLRWTVSGILVAINLPLLPSPAFAAFAVCFLATYASFHWFFYPPMKDRLLLAFATHNPIVVVMAAYAYALYLGDFAGARPSWPAALLVVGAWLPMAGWEWSRKIRLPEQETGYTTYSKILGWRRATLIVMGFWAISAGCLAVVLHRVGLGAIGAGCALAVALVAIGRGGLLLLAPTPARANLRPIGEAVVLAMSIGVPAALGIELGLSTRFGR